ncbi:regulator of nonsense transcripts 2-like isoform X2 [Haliotis rufescens]|uniref:regulator of nonsense transcripts 2-like isoform X2 n=2 Tax=Haliotis rufescens TaxID=6454 RepID=UPI001EB0834B|nr:regulator of nonsense transcripts 2-like isoform X2 [Haliotis rufescens]
MDSNESKQDEGSKSTKGNGSGKDGPSKREDGGSKAGRDSKDAGKDVSDRRRDDYPSKTSSRDGGKDRGRMGNGDRRKEPPPHKSVRKGAGDGPGDYRDSRDRYDDYYDRRSSGQGRPPPDRGDRRQDSRKGSSFVGKPDKLDKKPSTPNNGTKTKDVKTPAKIEQDRKAQKEKEEEEKKKKEEEKKKNEEEKKRKEEEEKQLAEQRRLEEEERKLKEEEERKRLEEERAKQQLEDEKKMLQDYIEETREKLTARVALREKNIAAVENRPDESFFGKLDSSLKKNTAFVKRLRNMTESQFEGFIKDFGSLNLTKYIGEAASALAEVKLKMSDVQSAVQLCSLMHQRYAEFTPALLENFQKYLLNKKDEKISNLSKYRVDLRFFAELISVGVFSLKEGLPVLANQLSILVNNDKDEHNNLSIISSFCKHCGDDYVGIMPRKIRLLSEKHHGAGLMKSKLLPPERQKACRNLLKDYSSSLMKHLIKDHKELKGMERQNRRILQTKGELSNERRDAYENALTTYQKLHTSAAVLADLLDEDLPDLPDEDLKQDESGGMFDFFSPMKGAECQYEGDCTLFEDEDTRTFYESLPDLRSFIPGILYKDSEQSSSKDANKEPDPVLEEVDLECLEVEDLEVELEEKLEEKLAVVDGSSSEVEDKDSSVREETAEDTAEDRSFIPPEADEDDGETGTLMKTQFEAYLQSLPNCVNRDLIDKAAIEFCMNFNTKSNRRKLVRGLFTVHRTRYDLLPFYARLVAILNPCMPDVATDLVQYLKGDFKWHIKKKDQINIESKLKTVRFLGELVKFKMCPKVEVLHCLKMLMFDFSHHNIEMACALLESCGRFLYRSMDSHHRTKAYLDVMMRKKAALHLDSRYTTMIENAYFYSNPPEYQQVARIERPPMHEYIRKLLYKDLSKITTEKVLRQMRKLDWDDVAIAFYTTKCLTAVWNIRYNSVHCAANLLAGLAPYHEHVAIQVVDGVLEDIRLGMEVNHPKYNQRRVSCVKYLGELYNYRMVESAVIFKTLYSFITFGISLDENPTPLDPPEHLFRVRLVCTLLETCGQYFDKGSSKKKLDCFLVYFQRYYWFKMKNPIWTVHRPFPQDVKNLVKDTLEMIRPKLKIYVSWEEAIKAAEDIENEYKTKIANLLPIFETGDESEVSEEEGLTPIQETDEEIDELSQSLSQSHLEDGTESSQDDQSGQSRSQTGSQARDGEDESEDSDRDEFLESAGEDETEDQITLVTGAPKRIVCQEDDDFMTAFDKMMSENIQARAQESLKVPQLDIAMPVHLRSKTKKTVPGTGTGVTQPIPEVDTAINFVLMTRKGNKAQFTNLNVPISAEFAAKFKEREQAEKMEKEKMKQVVLGIQQRQEEEDYQEMMASLNRPVPVNTNRERRIRYSHPKGAPDADLIFGSKKR